MLNNCTTRPKAILNGKVIDSRSLVLALLSTMLLNGCNFNTPKSTNDGLKSNADHQCVMPNVVNTDVNASGSKLTAAGLKVFIKVSEHTVPPKDGVGNHSYTLPGTIKPFEPNKWNHMIASQLPIPGTPIHAGTLVTLTTGNHHGAGPFLPWLVTHKWSVKVRGERRCRDCHTQTYCLEMSL